MTSVIFRVSLMIVSVFVSLTSFAANYIEVRNNPTEGNLKRFIQLLEQSHHESTSSMLHLITDSLSEHFFDPGIHGIDPIEGPGTIYLAPELRDFADVYLEKRRQLYNKATSDRSVAIQ